MIKFILHRPRNPKNIGAAARGMANFGFRDLAVVEPYAKAWRETRSAVHAGEVVKKAKKFKTVEEALRKSHLVIGTSAGSRRNLNEKWIELPQLASVIENHRQKKQNISILFGSEKTGLSNEELAFCHFIVKIPTVAECPSMNLAQAVAVVAYALRENVSPTFQASEKITVQPVAVEIVERLISQGLKALEKAGLLKGWDMNRSQHRLRKSFYQWNLTAVDVAMLHGIFRWMLKKRPPEKTL